MNLVIVYLILIPIIFPTSLGLWWPTREQVQTICYDDPLLNVGCYHKNGSFRYLPFPSHPKSLKIKFRVYHINDSGSGWQSEIDSFQRKPANYEFYKLNGTLNFLDIAGQGLKFPSTKGRKLLFIIHGFRGTIHKPFVVELRKALLQQKIDRNLTIVVVQWSRGAMASFIPTAPEDKLNQNTHSSTEQNFDGTTTEKSTNSDAPDQQTSTMSKRKRSITTSSIRRKRESRLRARQKRAAWTHRLIRYDQAVSNSRVVGALVGRFAYQIMTQDSFAPSDVHCIGFSLGAHVCGYAGKFYHRLASGEVKSSTELTTQQAVEMTAPPSTSSDNGNVDEAEGELEDEVKVTGRNTGGTHIAISSPTVAAIAKEKFDRITGLDPAGPIFEDFTNPRVDHLWYSDADFVDVVHTNAMTLGIQRDLGHIDFYPGSKLVYGAAQPGCSDVGLVAGLEGSARFFGTHSKHWVHNSATYLPPGAKEQLLNEYTTVYRKRRQIKRRTRINRRLKRDGGSRPESTSEVANDSLTVDTSHHEVKRSTKYESFDWVLNSGHGTHLLAAANRRAFLCSHHKSWRYYLQSILAGPSGSNDRCLISAELPVPASVEQSSNTTVLMSYYLKKADLPQGYRFKLRVEVATYPPFCKVESYNEHETVKTVDTGS